MEAILGLQVIMIGPCDTEADQDQTSGSTQLNMAANPVCESGFFNVASGD